MKLKRRTGGWSQWRQDHPREEKTMLTEVIWFQTGSDGLVAFTRAGDWGSVQHLVKSVGLQRRDLESYYWERTFTVEEFDTPPTVVNLTLATKTRIRVGSVNHDRVFLGQPADGYVFKGIPGLVALTMDEYERTVC